MNAVNSLSVPIEPGVLCSCFYSSTERKIELVKHMRVELLRSSKGNATARLEIEPMFSVQLLTRFGKEDPASPTS